MKSAIQDRRRVAGAPVDRWRGGADLFMFVRVKSLVMIIRRAGCRRAGGAAHIDAPHDRVLSHSSLYVMSA